MSLHPMHAGCVVQLGPFLGAAFFAVVVVAVFFLVVVALAAAKPRTAVKRVPATFSCCKEGSLAAVMATLPDDVEAVMVEVAVTDTSRLVAARPIVVSIFWGVRR